MLKGNNYWRIGGNKLRTINRTINRMFKSLEPETMPEDDQTAATKVGRHFNFPIKGEMIDRDGMKTLRNIETNFNEVARRDQRADILILRQYSYELITSKTFKAMMMVAIVINTILTVLPILMANNNQIEADKIRVPITIIETVIGKAIYYSDLLSTVAFKSEYSCSKYSSNCLPCKKPFGTTGGMVLISSSC